MSTLFTPIKLAGIPLKNRIVMPPMTRSRATQPGDEANSLMAEYYTQRASAGLVISEGTQVSALAKGYAWTPGIYTAGQIEGWRIVTAAVHKAGGTMFAQLWHVGRVSHPANTDGQQPVAPSAIQAEGVKVFVDSQGEPGFVQAALPRQMNQQDIDEAIDSFRQAALNAREAGFDGIELHAANGYLINQFMDSQSNQRTDHYGHSVENRLRFLRQIVEAVAQAIGAERIGVRLAPLTTLNGTVDDNPEDTYVKAAAMLNQLHVGYLHIAEADWDDAPQMPVTFKQAIREVFDGVLIYAGKYDKARAQQAIDEGWADMIGFGRPFVANPDLPARLKADIPLAQHQPDTLFGGGAAGYTDYPGVV